MVEVQKSRTISYTDLIFVWVGVTIVFAAIYWFLDRIPGQGVLEPFAAAGAILHWYDALYFSVTTGTTVGYGDLIPIGAARFFSAVHVMVSYVLLAVLVSKFASRSQDAAIHDIHSLARDSLFNNFRHGLFISRKDLDKLIEKVEGGDKLSDRDWRNLRTALRHMHTQIRNLPQLYTSGRSQDLLDEDHEQLLLDSVERSLRRVRELIEIFDCNDHTCKSDARCYSEIEVIVNASEHTFYSLHTHAENSENEEAYSEVLSRLAELKERV
jgi:potassium channel LctB